MWVDLTLQWRLPKPAERVVSTEGLEAANGCKAKPQLESAWPCAWPVHDDKHPRQLCRLALKTCSRQAWWWWMEGRRMGPKVVFFYPPWSLKTLWPKKTKESVCMVGHAKMMERGQPRCWGQPPPLSTAIRASVGSLYPKQANKKIGFFLWHVSFGVGDGEVLVWVLGCS